MEQVLNLCGFPIANATVGDVFHCKVLGCLVFIVWVPQNQGEDILNKPIRLKVMAFLFDASDQGVVPLEVKYSRDIEG